MFSMKWSRFGAVAILATLGIQNLVWGQPLSPPCSFYLSEHRPTVPPADRGRRPGRVAQVKAAVTALDQRFAAAGTSADGWKEYLSWDQFKSELQKAKPDDAVLADVYKNWPRAMKGWS